MDPVSLGISGLLNLTFSGISAIFAMVSVWGQFRRVDALKELTEQLRTIAGKDTAARKRDLLNFLRHMMVIAPMLRTIVLQRLGIALVLIIGGASVVPLDLSGRRIGETSLDWSDPVVFCLQVMLAIAVRKNLFLRKAERRFLANSTALNRIFFERYVSPAIDGFNKAVSESLLAQLVDSALRSEQARIRRLLNSDGFMGTPGDFHAGARCRRGRIAATDAWIDQDRAAARPPGDTRDQ